ncbi:MAG: carboxypeptidase-like regulatory domain-containing protein, partial [Gemmatimonadaceae bacterium]
MNQFNIVSRSASRWLLVLSAACLGLTSMRTAAAQTTTGSIRGYIRNEAGAPIPDAQISLRNPAMDLTRGTLTNANGFYNIAGLRPAEYEVSVRRLGFTAQTRTVQVEIGQTITLDIQL